MAVQQLDLAAVADHVESVLRDWRVPGAGLAAVRDGQVVIAQGYGLRDHTLGLPATAGTLFHQGSLTKAFTGTLLGALVDAGLLDWDQPVREVWPEFRLADPVATEQVSVADLLSHRSGLARHEWVWLANPSWSAAELCRRLRHLPMAHGLRAEFEYSNLGYAVLGQVVEAASGVDWHTALRERILDPLDMTATATTLKQAEDSGECARPHDVESDSIVGTSFRVIDNVAPAGQLFASPADMARWLLFQLGDGTADGRRVLTTGTLRKLHRIRTPLDLPGPDAGVHLFGYAFGWIAGIWQGRRILWHNGGIDGFGSETLILPDDGVAVAVSVNSDPGASLPAATAISRHVAQVLLGEQPGPRPGRDDEQAEPDDDMRTVPGTGPSHPLADFAGGYHHPGYGTLTVESDGQQLRFRLGELAFAGRHRHYDTWTLEYQPLEETTSVTFRTGADGIVREAVLPLEPATADVVYRRPPGDPKTPR